MRTLKLLMILILVGAFAMGGNSGVYAAFESDYGTLPAQAAVIAIVQITIVIPTRPPVVDTHMP